MSPHCYLKSVHQKEIAWLIISKDNFLFYNELFPLVLYEMETKIVKTFCVEQCEPFCLPSFQSVIT